MRLLLCSAVLATAIFGVCSFPTDLTQPEVPRRGGGNPNSKPQQSLGEKPRPNLFKPNPLSSEAVQSPSTYIVDLAHSSVSSDLPLPPAEASVAEGHETHSSSSQMTIEPAYDPILETANSHHIPESVVQDVIPELELPEAVDVEIPAAAEIEIPAAVEIEIPAVQVEAAAAPTIEQDVLSIDSHVVPSELTSATFLENLEIDSGAQSITPDVDVQLENSHAKKIVNFAKSRRHAGVEHPTVLRIGDFEDVEADPELLPYALKVAPEYPSTYEQKELHQELSKEEMILMAMDQMHHNLPQVQLSRPAAKRPTGFVNSPINLNSGSIIGNHKPHYDNIREEYDDTEQAENGEESSNENDGTVDLRNGEPPATIVQEQSTVSKVPVKEPTNPSTHNHTPYVYGNGSKTKPRPYGMDKPSKNRPTLESGVKDKNEHFGLPHSSSSGDAYVQKGESTESSSISYLGFQIPNIKWTSFTDLFPSFWGTRLKNHEGMSMNMGKSDQASEQSEEPCVEDEPVNEGVRSPVIQGSTLCASSGTPNYCHEACRSNGFASGSCLGPYPTPGCLCRMPKSKEFGVVLQPLTENPSAPVADNREQQDLEISVSATCKKCACMDSCKRSGSYTGFCIDRCYCAVPWYNKQA